MTPREWVQAIGGVAIVVVGLWVLVDAYRNRWSR